MYSSFPLLLAGLTIVAPAPEKRPEDFVAFRVTTELQKRVLVSSDVCFYVEINGNALMDKEFQFDERKFNLAALESALQAEVVRDKPSVNRSNIQIIITFSKVKKDPETKAIVKRFEKWTKDNGYPEAKISISYSDSDSWENILNITAKQTGFIAENIDEDPIGDDDIKFYRRQSILSRCLISEDCVVEFIKAFPANFDGFLDEAMQKKIIENVAELHLKKKESMMFVVRYRKGEEKKAKKLEFDGIIQLTKRLEGFKGTSQKLMEEPEAKK